MDEEGGAFTPLEAEVQVIDDLDDSSEGVRAETDGGGHREYGEIELKVVRVPVFVLTAPSVEGCKATMTRSGEGSLGWGLELKLFGNGFSLGKKLTVGWSQAVTASSGRINRVFLPVWLDVQQVVTTFDDGREERVSYEMTLRADKMALNQVGVETVEALPPGLKGHVRLIEALLKGSSDPEPVIQGFSYAMETTGGLDLGFKAMGADQTLKIDGSMTRSREFEATLVSGHDYEAVGSVWPPTVIWSVDSTTSGV